MRYLWRDHSFEIPDGLADRSVLLMVDEREDTPPFSLSFAHDVLTGADAHALSRYVDEVIREGTVRLASLRVVARDARALGGRDVVEITQDASPEPGQSVRQLQAFVRDGAHVTIITATAELDDAARAHDALRAVLGSLQKVTA